jgi:hypothetical protein
MLFGSKMTIHAALVNHVASASHTVVLTKSGFSLINLLIDQHMCSLGEHILKHDLINHPGVFSSASCLPKTQIASAGLFSTFVVPHFVLSLLI